MSVSLELLGSLSTDGRGCFLSCCLFGMESRQALESIGSWVEWGLGVEVHSSRIAHVN